MSIVVNIHDLESKLLKLLIVVGILDLSKKF